MGHKIPSLALYIYKSVVMIIILMVAWSPAECCSGVLSSPGHTTRVLDSWTSWTLSSDITRPLPPPHHHCHLHPHSDNSFVLFSSILTWTILYHEKNFLISIRFKNIRKLYWSNISWPGAGEAWVGGGVERSETHDYYGLGQLRPTLSQCLTASPSTSHYLTLTQ